MSLSVYSAFLVACIVIILVPGPTVTLIVANSIRHGTRAGLANVAGTQVGLGIAIAIVGVGLTSLIEGMGHWFEWVRLLGAAYLIWIGVQLFRQKGRLSADGTASAPHGGFFLQGLLVALSNPKMLIFFGAFLPQFIDPSGNHAAQIAIMGVTAMICAAVSDSGYAFAAGRAARALSASRMRLLSRIGCSFLIGGGLWLAVSRAK